MKAVRVIRLGQIFKHNKLTSKCHEEQTPYFHSGLQCVRLSTSDLSVSKSSYSIHKDTSNEIPPSKVDSIELLRKIVAKYQQKLRTFVLPWGDLEAIEEIRRSFDQLIILGHGEKTFKMLTIFVQCCGWTYEDSIRYFTDWTDELLALSPESVQRRLDVFLGRGVTAGIRISNIITQCPEILYAIDAQKMDQTWEDISAFFYSGNVKKMIENNPRICLNDPKLMEQKYEYISFHMALESEELMYSRQWIELSLDEIQDRHKLIQKTGRFITPNPKKPQFTKDNPSARDIFDTSNEQFAQIAGVSYDEWIIFREICENERSDVDVDRPFDRIKPSQRRAYERRLKKPLSERSRASLDNNILFLYTFWLEKFTVQLQI